MNINLHHRSAVATNRSHVNGRFVQLRKAWIPSVLMFFFLTIVSVSTFADGNVQLSNEDLSKARASLTLINSKLSKLSKSPSQIKLMESSDINLGPTPDDSGVISVTTALIREFADDRDAIASLIARQQALPNVESNRKTERLSSPTIGKLMGMLGSAVNGAVDSKIGVSGVSQTFTEGGGEIINSLYTRAQNNAADESSIKWLLEAGYNPQGALRAQRKLLSLSANGRTVSISENHPASEERVAYIEALLDDNAKAKAMDITLKTALWMRINPAETFAPVGSVAAPPSVDNAKQSSGSAEKGTEDSDSVSLSRYAVIKNEIAFSGAGPALNKHGLSADAFSKIDRFWSARMAQDTSLALAQQYVIHYLEASQGEFADWGIDVAQIKQTGKLQLGTDPTGVDDWISLHKARKSSVSGGPDAAASFTQAAKEKGLSDYDFNIVDAWWTQRAKDYAAKGDKTLLQRIN